MKRRTNTWRIVAAALTVSVQVLCASYSFGQTQAQEDSLVRQEENIVDNPVLETPVIANVNPTDIPDVPDELIADRLSCLEKEIKLTYNKRIRGFIDYFTVRNRNYSLVMERRKNVYFPIFEEALKRHNMPDELKYLSIVESGLNPKAYSRAGAAGLWQFMPSTGKMYSLHQDQFIDERMDPYESTEAACKYLRELYNIFHDWELALASYNCGPGNVRRAIRKSGYKDGFWEIYNYLPAETRGYVPQFVAVVYSMNHLKDHNIFADSLEYPIAFDTIRLNQHTNLDILCSNLNICKEDFQKLNPALKKNIVPDNLNYAIRIPADKIELLTLNRAAIMDSCKAKAEDINIALKAPVPVTTASAGQKKTIYVVKNGDVLGKIADRNHVSVTNLKKWNNIKGNTIRSGQKLVIYKNGGAALPATRNLASTSTSKPIAKTGSKTGSIPHVHYVQPGDTLWTISKKYNNLSIEKIKKLNNLKGNEIKPGMKLVLS
ncbi:MAG: transglycosylase SLT domain-containing protein [Cytophagaceae bacterium]